MTLAAVERSRQNRGHFQSIMGRSASGESFESINHSSFMIVPSKWNYSRCVITRATKWRAHIERRLFTKPLVSLLSHCIKLHRLTYWNYGRNSNVSGRQRYITQPYITSPLPIWTHSRLIWKHCFSMMTKIAYPQHSLYAFLVDSLRSTLELFCIYIYITAEPHQFVHQRLIHELTETCVELYPKRPNPGKVIKSYCTMYL